MSGLTAYIVSIATVSPTQTSHIGNLFYPVHLALHLHLSDISLCEEHPQNFNVKPPLTERSL